MKSPLAPDARFWLLLALLICIVPLGAIAEPVAVRHVQGTIHGFLEMRSEDGHVLAAGDAVQVAHGDQVTSRTTFHFKDGSLDDETTVFSQRRMFRLISDHHVQKGPAFPHPMDVMIEARGGTVTVRTDGKDGKEEVHTDKVALPPDLANGMVPLVIENLRLEAAETTVPMVVMTPKPRLVKLVISPQEKQSFSIAGTAHEALHYEVKIEIGGVAGMVAPLIGKAPPNIEIWIVGGEAPTFLREQGPIYADGPIMTIELASPVWGEVAKSGN